MVIPLILPSSVKINAGKEAIWSGFYFIKLFPLDIDTCRLHHLTPVDYSSYSPYLYGGGQHEQQEVLHTQTWNNTAHIFMFNEPERHAEHEVGHDNHAGASE